MEYHFVQCGVRGREVCMFSQHCITTLFNYYTSLFRAQETSQKKCECTVVDNIILSVVDQTVNSPNCRQFGAQSSVLYLESVLYSGVIGLYHFQFVL